MLMPGGRSVRRPDTNGKRSRRTVDELVELDAGMTLVQTALELVAEQRRDRLPVAHALHQRDRGAHARRRQVDREGLRRGRIRRAKDSRCAARRRWRPAAATAHGCSRRSQRPRTRRRPRRCAAPAARTSALTRWRVARRRTHVLEPAEGAEMQPLRRAVAAQRSEPLSVERGDPGVEPVRAEIDVLGHQPLEPRRRQIGERRDRLVGVGGVLDRRWV